MGWERSGRCKFRGRGKKTKSTAPQTGFVPSASPPPPSPPLPPPPPPPPGPSNDSVYFTIETWNDALKSKPLSHPPLSIYDAESGEVIEFEEKRVPFENVDESNQHNPTHWINTRENLNPDFQLKPVGRGENPFHVMDENRNRFMEMNDISLENFSCSTPKNLHLWQQRPSQWLPRTKDFWCWW